MAKFKWIVDPAHSEIQFKVRHLMITTVTGYFSKFSIEVETEDEDFTKASKLIFTADVDSINTNNAQRDAHLRSGDFFNTEKYKEIRFVGKSFEKISDDRYRLNGELTIKDVSKSVDVVVELMGVVVDPYGNKKAGFTVDSKINRKDFNLTWNAVTEAGQIVVSDEIQVHAEVQLIKQEVEKAATDVSTAA